MKFLSSRLRSGVCAQWRKTVSNKLLHSFRNKNGLGLFRQSACRWNPSRNKSRHSRTSLPQRFHSKSGSHGVCRDSHSGFSSASGGSRRTRTARRGDRACGWNAAVVEGMSPPTKRPHKRESNSAWPARSRSNSKPCKSGRVPACRKKPPMRLCSIWDGRFRRAWKIPPRIRSSLISPDFRPSLAPKKPSPINCRSVPQH